MTDAQTLLELILLKFHCLIYKIGASDYGLPGQRSEQIRLRCAVNCGPWSVSVAPVNFGFKEQGIQPAPDVWPILREIKNYRAIPFCIIYFLTYEFNFWLKRWFKSLMLADSVLLLFLFLIFDRNFLSYASWEGRNVKTFTDLFPGLRLRRSYLQLCGHTFPIRTPIKFSISKEFISFSSSLSSSLQYLFI